MDGQLVLVRIIPYRTKEIKVYKDGRCSFANIIFPDENTAKKAVDLLLRTNEIKNPNDKDEDVMQD